MKPTNTEKDYLNALISEGEHIHQDFKYAITDSRKIAKSISAFANTEGGRLLIGVKDNGHIAGIRSEEEIYMIEAAANMYCVPPVAPQSRTYSIDGKSVLEIYIAEEEHKPVCALDNQGRPWAYVRVRDENIVASPVHLNIWKHNREDTKVIVSYTPREQQVLDTLKDTDGLTLNQCCRRTGFSRKEMSRLLADFVRFGLIETHFSEHSFRFQLAEEK